ncbi:MAG: formylglycine-generating enzyme family protein [Deltaproteobacteria bacterium]|nr:formylglycine-generating enzyme family protein [Deltaproteobacteria bacterium]
MAAALTVSAAVTVCAATDDYDQLTGEPNCVKCHTSERRYSIDYTRDETCTECHGAGVSDKYNAINNRFTSQHARNETGGVKTDVAAGGAEGRSGSVEQAQAMTEDTPKKAEAPMVESAKDAPKDMALVPAGEFTMGSDDWWPKSQPRHKRNLKGFYMDKYEVTNRRYKKFVDATGHRIPDHWLGGRIPKGKDNHPVVFVDWSDADAFCKWEGKRLPAEDEWEKAARGTKARAFPWGDEFAKEKANTPQYDHKDTMPVGSFESGKSPYGIYDMAGNVWEWTTDWFKPYPGNKHPDENYGEKFKSVRGGSWYDCTYYKCGISAPTYNRIFFHPKTKNNNFGVRCAQDAR